MTDEEILSNQIRDINRDVISEDFAHLKTLFTTNAHLRHISGKTSTITEWIQQFKKGRIKFFNCTEKFLQVFIDGDSATAIIRTQSDVRLNGLRNEWPVQTEVKLQKQNNNWKITDAYMKLY